ncbi:unnamed protein product [Blepharisma stoltei]|uniref:Uncharacterized protein n=1 Tax=Blepharisma stoltei TaxID=1481888 RepID=A0AAU9IQG4_9CILI|nr:unnamed protein product [Blepharisma stoltei]
MGTFTYEAKAQLVSKKPLYPLHVNLQHQPRLERFTSQLGFSDREMTYIELPIPLKLKHYVYHILADQVACGLNFTCIIGNEKVTFGIFKTDEEEEEGKEEAQEEAKDKVEDPFDYEIADDDCKPTKAALDNLRSPKTSVSLEEIIIVGKHLKCEIAGHLSEHKHMWMKMMWISAQSLSFSSRRLIWQRTLTKNHGPGSRFYWRRLSCDAYLISQSLILR